jgi:hypothetical protein
VETPELSFLDIVRLYELQTYVALGKMSDPMTGQMNPNLQMAQVNIGILEVLSEKTQGNLSDEENSYLQNSLTNLRMNYVEESRKGGDAGDGQSSNETTESEIVKPESGIIGPDGKPLK